MCYLFYDLLNRMCRDAIQPQPPPLASVEVRSAFKRYNASAMVLRGVSLTVRRNTMYVNILLLIIIRYLDSINKKIYLLII